MPRTSPALATRLVFLLTGVGYSAWAALVPFARARAGLDDTQLGLLLLCSGLGSIAAMPFAGALAARLGCRAVIAGATLLVATSLPLLSVLQSWHGLMLALAAFGCGIGALDVTMNIQAIMVERGHGRPLMSGFHGLFSLGGIVGAGGLALLLPRGLPVLGATLIASAALLVLLGMAVPGLLSRDGATSGEPAGPAFALPRGPVLLIGACCFVLFLAEGAVLDWSAVFLSTVRHMNPDLAGFGYSAFAATMTIGRLCGDRIVAAFGPRRIVPLGACCAAGGFALCALAPSAPVSLLGFALVGVGCANIVPVLFSAAGRLPSMPESVALPAIATLGYAGILVGPAAIGLAGGLIGLPGALLLLAGLLVPVAFIGRRV